MKTSVEAFGSKVEKIQRKRSKLGKRTPPTDMKDNAVRLECVRAWLNPLDEWICGVDVEVVLVAELVD